MVWSVFDQFSHLYIHTEIIPQSIASFTIFIMI